MTELEKIAYAKSFIDKLANGINPIDNTPIPEGDIANNVRLSRCFFYVSDILRQVCENGGIGKSNKKVSFAITDEELAKFVFSPLPIAGSEISRRLGDTINNPLMKSFSVTKMNQWLLSKGFLKDEITMSGKKRKVPTDMGKQLGICMDKRVGQHGEYMAMLYNTSAQKFIIDNIREILSFEAK